MMEDFLRESLSVKMGKLGAHLSTNLSSANNKSPERLWCRILEIRRIKRRPGKICCEAHDEELWPGMFQWKKITPTKLTKMNCL